MTEAQDRRPRQSARDSRRQKALLARRVAAGVLVAAAAAVGWFVSSIALSPASLMLGAGAGLLVVLALMLFVDLPVPPGYICLAGLTCAALLALGFVDHYYARVDGRLVPRYKLITQLRVSDAYPKHFSEMESLERLDMRASTVTDFTPLYGMGSLQSVDLRDNHAFTQEEHDALALALPGCDVRWSVPVTGAWFDSASEVVDLTALPLTASEINGLIAAYPQKRFIYEVPLYGQRWPMDAQALDLTGKRTDVKAIEEALALLKDATSVDLRGEKTPADDVAALCDAHPQVRFMFTCDVPNGEMTTEDASITVTGSYDDLAAYMAYVEYMPNLKSLDATAVPLTNEQVDAVNAGAYANIMSYNVNAFGVSVSSQATELNLDNIKISSVEEVEQTLARLPKLQRVSMCDCGLSEDEMGRLFDAHPDIKFVWWIEFGHYKLRTDATSFTTGLGTGNRYGYNDETFHALRYCTDLMMLDLGHNHVTSLANFTGMKKLRVLIMADNKLTAIPEITSFPDLEFVELFLNDITDVTPLTELKKLMDLNIFYNPLYDNYKPLETMTWLKRLWIGGCRLSKQDVAELRAALPNTKINVEGHGSTGHGWRKHPHYDVLKQMYEEERYVPFEDSQPLDG